MILQGVLVDDDQIESELQERARRAAEEILQASRRAEQGQRAVARMASLPEATVIGMHTEASENTGSSPEIQSKREQERAKKRKQMILGLRLLFSGVIVLGAVVGTVIVRSNASPAHPGGNGITSASPPTLGPTHQMPTASTLSYFSTKEELYQAVDTYLLDKSATSSVAIEYGHPIETWNISGISDLSHVFSSERKIDESCHQHVWALLFGNSVQWKPVAVEYLKSNFNVWSFCRGVGV